MSKRILTEHFAETRKEFLKHSNHLGIVDHGSIKGYVREALINEFLSKNLPPIVDFTTGEIIDRFDKKSGQIDIILQSISDPRISIYNDFHIALCDSVLATIEVKSNLTTGKPGGSNSLSKALETIEKVKSLNRKIPIENIYHIPEQKWSIPSFVYSYSGPKIETLIHAIDKYIDFKEYSLEKADRYLPEIIAVLDKGYFLYKDDGWIYKSDRKKGENITSIYRTNENEDEVLIGLFIYLCNLIQSWNQKHWNSNYLDYIVSIQ